MPALDFTTWIPSKASGATGGIGRGASSDGARGRAEDRAEDGPETGSPGAAHGEFGQLVDRLADGPDEDQASSRGAIGSRFARHGRHQ